MKPLLPLLLVIVIAGCSQKEKTPTPAPSDPSTQSSETLQPSKDGLRKLSADANPYIRHNAKAALESWEARDYTAVVIAMQKIVSLCRSESQVTATMTSLAQLKSEIDAAAAKGNSNAKEAAAQIKQISPIQ